MTQRLSAEERREEIAEAVLRLAGQEGFHRLTTALIAKSIDVSEATLFRHFRDKQDIIAAALVRFEELVMADFPPKEEHPLEALRAFFFQRIALIRKHPEIKSLAFNVQLLQIASEESAARISFCIGQMFQFVFSSLQKAQEQRMIANDLPLEVFLWSFLGVLRGYTDQIQEAPSTPQDEAYSQTLWLGLEQLLRRSK
ncbi:TetR/AcrR family transcriptional regulator [Myxococcota bacterium]|nr:TetR/AcrR family transcriptional regulator [Myxococcota bacterium]